MFKRILVLALFLFGVFWWFGQKDGGIKKGDIIKKTEIEESQKTEGKENSDINSSEEEDNNSKDKEDSQKSIEKNVDKTDTKSEDSKSEATDKIEKNSDNSTSEVKNSEKSTQPQAKNNSVTAKTAQTVIKSNYIAPKNNWKPKPVVIEKTEVIPDRQINVKTYMYEWNIDFSQKKFQSGTINFQVKNNGRFSHEFGIETLGSIGKIMPGENKTFTVKLAPGTYEVFSKRRSDYEKGMKDIITITN